MNNPNNQNVKSSNEISLLITRAEIRDVTISKGGEVTATIELFVGTNPLTSVYLTTDRCSKGTPHELAHSPLFEAIKSELFNLVKQQANISLERVGNKLSMPEADVINTMPNPASDASLDDLGGPDDLPF